MNLLITSAAIRRLQETTGLTDEDIAARIGVTPRTVRGWRRGLSVPRMERAEQIAKAFGLNLWEFYDVGQRECNT